MPPSTDAASPAALLDRLLAVKMLLEAAERGRGAAVEPAWAQVDRAALLVGELIGDVRRGVGPRLGDPPAGRR